MISFPCAGCGRAIHVHDDAAGRQVKCGGCGAVAAVPSGPPPAPFIPTAVSTAANYRRPRASWVAILGAVVCVAGLAISAEAGYRLVRYEQRAAAKTQPPPDSILGGLREGVDRIVIGLLWERIVAGWLVMAIGAAIVKIDCDVPR